MKECIMMFHNSLKMMCNFRRHIINMLSEKNNIILLGPYDEKIHFDIRNVVIIANKFNRKSLNPLEALSAILRSNRVIKENEIKLIINYTMKPILLGTISGKLNKVPIINIPTGLGFLFIRNSIINKLLRKLVIKMMRLSSETWVLNKSDYNIIKKSSKKINISIMPGEGVDIEKFKEEHYMISEPIKLLMVARILKDKGVFEYIYAAKYISRKYTNVEFHYAGDIDVTGNPTAISKEMFNNLLKDSKIKYHGYINDIKHLLEKIDVLVLPSYREGLSMVLLEAASMKKILIASNVPGCKELVHNSGKYHNGFTCKPRSTSSLIRSIEKTISSKEKWNLMRCNSRMLVKDKYSSDIVIKYYKNKLKKYIGEQ